MPNEFSVSASLKGAIGETLLTKHKTAVRKYFSDWCLDDLESHNPEWIPDVEHQVKFDIERPPHSYDISIDGDFATWYPDALYTLQFESAIHASKTFDRYTVEFPVEIKTGQWSELSDNQRAVMATIEQQSNPVFPIRIRVDVSDLPDSFSVTPHRIQQSSDEPLPTYTSDDSPAPPAETMRQTRDTSLAHFRSNDSVFEDIPDDIVEALQVASENQSTAFTVEDVLDGLESEGVEEDFNSIFETLQTRGVIYQTDDETWRFI